MPEVLPFLSPSTRSLRAKEAPGSIWHCWASHSAPSAVTHLSDLQAGKLGLTGLVGEGCSCFSVMSLTSS